MSQCATTPSAPTAQPIQIVPKKSVLNAHGCGGDCTVEDDSQARWPRAKVVELFNLPLSLIHI